MKTFETKIDDCEFTFTCNRLSMRQQEYVIDLLAEFRESIDADRKQAFAALREAVATCVAGWSSSKPIGDIDTELDMRQMVQVANVTLKGNTTSEDDRKKSE